MIFISSALLLFIIRNIFVISNAQEVVYIPLDSEVAVSFIGSEVEINPFVYIKMIDNNGTYINPGSLMPKSYTYEVNEELLFRNFGINLGNQNFAQIDESNRVINCENDTYYFVIDEQNFTKDLLDNLSNGVNSIELSKYIAEGETEMLEVCKKFNSEIIQISTTLENSIGLDKTSVNSYIGLFNEKNDYIWDIYNHSLFDSYITKAKEKFTVAPFPGAFEEFDNFVAIYVKPINGKEINVEKTKDKISRWLNNRNSIIALEFDSVNINRNFNNKPVYDLTNLVGSGQTRIDLIRDGQGNSAVYFAELGLEEVQKVIIMPGEEFSYLKQIAKQPGLNRTASGRLIGMGYCNSTTTIFRAALETGLPITDRSSHGTNIASYDWGYPMNIVDSTFYAVEGSEIDLKFINDFDYPIMLYYEKEQDENNFQYHYVHIFTSSEAQKRKVELYDWRKWGVYSPTHFQAEFKRRVWENNNVKLEDSFFSRYIDR